MIYQLFHLNLTVHTQTPQTIAHTFKDWSNKKVCIISFSVCFARAPFNLCETKPINFLGLVATAQRCVPVYICVCVCVCVGAAKCPAKSKSHSFGMMMIFSSTSDSAEIMDYHYPGERGSRHTKARFTGIKTGRNPFVSAHGEHDGRRNPWARHHPWEKPRRRNEWIRIMLFDTARRMENYFTDKRTRRAYSSFSSPFPVLFRTLLVYLGPSFPLYVYVPIESKELKLFYLITVRQQCLDLNTVF